MKKIVTLILFACLFFNAKANLILTGILDGPLSGGTKVIEVYVTADIADLSVYGFEFANNGAAVAGTQEYTFPTGAASEGDFLYFANNADNCLNYLGFPADVVDNFFGQFNGDDVILLYQNGGIIDVFGEAGVDGSGTAWDHLDSWAYRNDFTGPDGDVFVQENWTVGTPEELVGATENSTSANPFPYGTYIYNTPANPILSFVGNSMTVNEAAGTVDISVSITAANANATSVNIMVDPSSTTDASDYSLSATTVTFPADSTTNQIITVTINDDAVQEIPETLVLMLDSPTNSATFGADVTYTITINDNDTPTPDLVINEIMYNVYSADTLEFIEIYNNDVMDVDLIGFSFSAGVDYNFVTSTVIAPGDYMVICNNTDAFQAAFGVSPPQWSGSLVNGGETITLVDINGNVVDEVTYMNTFPFPGEANGGGPSLELCDPNEDNANGLYWLPSMANTGYMLDTVELMASPGMMNTVMCPTVINPSLTFVGNSASHNEADGTISIDIAIVNGNDSITNVMVSVDPSSTATDMMDYTYTPVTLSFAGGVAVDTQTITIDLIDDTDQESLENLVLALTANDNNSELLVDSIFTVTISDNDTPPADLVITEIMYNDPGSGTDSLEFIEFVNNGTEAVNIAGATFVAGVNHTIQSTDLLGPGEYFVVCSNAVEFENAFGFAAEEWSGGLSNGGETIILNDASGFSVDTVTYNDNDPFPTSPAGNGPSLELCTDYSVDNNDPVNWYASTTATGHIEEGVEVFATPGAANTTVCGTVILDPTISFSADTITVNEDAGTITIDITMENGNMNDTDVTIVATSASTATDGDDFTFSPASVTFAGGMETGTQTVTINIADDAITEADETIVLAISGNNGSVTGANSTYTVTILDNDPISVDDVFQGKVRVQPNPVSDVLSILSEINIDEINIFNVLGQNVYNNQNITQRTDVDVNKFSKGIYFVHLTSDDATATYQIVVK